MVFKSGFIAVVGRPNAGKSTLVNALVGRKVSIVSSKPQTTRNRIQGIVNRDNAQIVLIDTPGISKADSALGRQMMQEAAQSLESIDVLALIADASQNFGPEDRRLLQWMERYKGPVYLLLNKIDRICKPQLLPLMDSYQKARQFTEIFPISALRGDGLKEVEQSLIAQLPEAPPYFPKDQFTDQPERFLASELIREKAILATSQEVPHAVAVMVDSFEETAKLIRIRATVYVEREGQKGILIGKGGSMLKRIGSKARMDLENLLGVKVFLELYVKVLANWRERPALVRQLDWHQQLERMTEE
jgi:GTPase